MGSHKDLTALEVHTPVTFTYADEAEREGDTLSASDVGKLAWQQDDDTFWILKDDSPLSWVQLGGAGGSTVQPDYYVATDGDDGDDGSESSPFLTVGHALDQLPALIDSDYTIHVADGTYAEEIDVRRFYSVNGAKIKIVGNATTPANVVFTGTVETTHEAETKTTTVRVDGVITVELEGIRINATADYGLWATNRAAVIVDRCSFIGTTVRAIRLNNWTGLQIQGNVSISGYTTFGIDANYHCHIVQNVAGTLTLTGASNSTWAVHMIASCTFFCWTANCNITITVCKYGFQFGFNCSFSHQGTGSTITVDNASTPASSAGVMLTDLSNWSTNQTCTFDNLTYAFEANSICYIEAVGTRNLTNMASGNSNASQNSVIHLP